MVSKREIDPAELALAASGEKPTLKTIARLSGLAVPTVSRALNDAPDIGADTKTFIRSIADAIGYVPNRAGVRLRTGRTNVISLILSTEHDMMNHTARLISSVAGALRHTPFHLNVTPYYPDEDVMRPIRYVVETKSADAVIFNQVRPEDPRVAYLMEHHFPFATHGRTIWYEDHPYADFDNIAYGRVAVAKLHERGRRKILFIAAPEEHNYGLEMREGAIAAAAELGCEVIFPAEVTSDSLTPLIQTCVAKQLSEDPQIDGIICGSTNATVSSAAGAEDAGRVIGETVDIVGKEAIPFLKSFRRNLLVLPEDIMETGRFLAEAAIQAVRDPELPPKHKLIVPTLADFGD